MVAAVRAAVHLAVAGADVDALGAEAVGVERFAVGTLVVVRAGQAFGQALPGASAVAGALDRELAAADPEIVAFDLRRHDVRGVGTAARDADREAVERR